MEFGQIVLVTADERSAAELIGRLQRVNHQVIIIHPEARLGEALSRLSPHMVFYALWGKSELDTVRLATLCQSVRAPVLVVGGPVNSYSAVEALRCGADGYLDRRHGLDSILAHAQAALRRYWEWGGRQLPACHHHLWQTRRSAHAAGVALTPAEERMLSYLQHNAGQVVPRQELCLVIWGREPRERDLRSLALFIHNLRCKIEQDPHRPQFLLTQRGVGYCLSDQFAAI